jgi:hypothetical protein
MSKPMMFKMVNHHLALPVLHSCCTRIAFNLSLQLIACKTVVSLKGKLSFLDAPGYGNAIKLVDSRRARLMGLSFQFKRSMLFFFLIDLVF